MYINTVALLALQRKWDYDWLTELMECNADDPTDMFSKFGVYWIF